MNKQTTIKAFGLIELLVVISIFLILISLLQPSSLSMINHTKRITCLTQLREIHQTMNFYADDYSGIYPESNPARFRYYPFLWNGDTLYEPLTQTYGLDWQTLICPAKDSARKPYRRSSNANGGWANAYSPSYSYIAGLTEYPRGKIFSNPRRIAGLRVTDNNPSDVVLADTNMTWMGAGAVAANHRNNVENPDKASVLYWIEGGNRMTNSGSGQWVPIENMGENDETPDPQIPQTAKYSAWSNVRPFYW